MRITRWRNTRIVAGAVALAATTALAACGGDEGDDGPITVYSGREEELVAPLFEQYEEQTGTELEVRYGDTAELAATLTEEGENSPADVFFGQDAGALGALEQEELLADIPGETLEIVEPRYRSEDGRWTGTSGRARVVAYNSEKLSESDLPDSILDFTEPEWKGRIGWAPTNGSFQAFVTAMRLTEGEEATEEWLRGIVANDPVVFDGNEEVRDAIASGEIDVGFINHYYVAQAIAAEGPDYPVKVYFPPKGLGSLLLLTSVGVLESSDRKDEAFDFIRTLLSKKGQEFFTSSSKEYPLAKGVPADPSLSVPLSQIPPSPGNLSDIGATQATIQLMQDAGAL